MSQTILKIEGLRKSFTLHAQGGVTLPVLSDLSLQIDAGECVVLEGPSGMGKSTLLKLVYANYRSSGGSIALRQADGQWLEVTRASEPQLLAMRHRDIGYVSQFLRVIPRVPAIDVVADSLLDDLPEDRREREAARAEARAEAGRWLERLRIPGSLWGLPPATFSGGEQQRINIARSLIRPRPLMLLDEPTASLDPANVDTVVTLIQELRDKGCAVLGIFHDPLVRDRVATRRFSMQPLRSPV